MRFVFPLLIFALVSAVVANGAFPDEGYSREIQGGLTWSAAEFAEYVSLARKVARRISKGRKRLLVDVIRTMGFQEHIWIDMDLTPSKCKMAPSRAPAWACAPLKNDGPHFYCTGHVHMRKGLRSAASCPTLAPSYLVRLSTAWNEVRYERCRTPSA